MRRRYRYQIDGTGADGQTWHTTGIVRCEFIGAFSSAMSASFEQLTNGKAVYGKPGVGCVGPYEVRHFSIEMLDDA